MYSLFIVDDEPKIRNGLCLGYPWNKLGFRVVGEAANGAEALEFIAVHQIDVILTDIRMPVFSGIDLVKRLREQNNQIKVVLLSGYREFEYAKEAIQFGVCDYLVKPTGYNDVVSTFSRIRDTLNREHGEIPDDGDCGQLGEGFYDKIINDVCSYINRNISDASLEGAARVVDRSVYYLSRLFKQQTGLKFCDYLMSKKMEHASSLLSNCRYGINEISNLLGYDSPKNFSRAFKAYYGESPRDYRNNPKGGEEALL